MSVVITGIGTIGSLGATRDQVWARALAGQARMTRPTGIDAAVTDLAGVVVAAVDDDELRHRLLALDERGIACAKAGRYRQLAVIAAVEAMDDAGLDGAAAGARGAIVMGAIASGTAEAQRITLRVHAGRRPRVADNLGKRTAVAVQDVARATGVRGTAFGVDAACASGAVALAQGRRLIASGDADWCLAGGVDASLTATNLMPARSLGALSTRFADSPNRASRPFEARRDGFVPAEGGCFLLLEDADHARRRGASVYAELAAAAEGVDAAHPTRLDECFIVSLMRGALERASLRPEEVTWIKAHASGTPQGDTAEARAIAAVFGAEGRDRALGTLPDGRDSSHEGVWVSAPKSLTGHLMAAAGAFEAALAAMSIRHGIIPPTINLDRQGDDCPVRLVTTARRMDVTAVLCNSLGFGGPGVCVAVKSSK